VTTNPTTDRAVAGPPVAGEPTGGLPLLSEMLGAASADPGGPSVGEEGPGAVDLPEWVTVGAIGRATSVDGALDPRRVLAQLALGVLAALLVVGVLGTLAARQLAEREAVNDAVMMANVLAEAVVEPSLSPQLFSGDPEAVSDFDEVARDRLLSDTIVRVKLWSPQGRVLYADEGQLVGRTFPLTDDQREALNQPATMAEVSALDQSENAFEQQEQALEVYRPVWTAAGQAALFEIYVSYEPVSARTGQLWRGFAGVTTSSLVLLVLIVAPIVWHLVRRIRRAEEQRVELLERAVDASRDERRRIAASLHDGPVQELAAASFTVAGASAKAGARGDGTLARDLDAAAASVRSGIRSLRTLLVDIYPAGLARSGIVAALHDLAQTSRRADLEVRVDASEEDTLALGEDAQRLVHRVAQECLRNAAKHAGPASVTVSLHRDGPTSVTLDVVDDGVGFDVEAVLDSPREGHLGLPLLADAASVPGALLQVSSGPQRGTHWRLVLDGPLGAKT
jgi:two-component system, NarL family, sensor kinase